CTERASHQMSAYVPSQFSTSTRPLMHTNAPVADVNKIRAIRARKDKIDAACVRSDIRSSNSIDNTLWNTMNSQTLNERLTAEKLFNRNFKLDRVLAQSSVLSLNPSLIWPSYGTAVTSRPKRSQSNSTMTITPPIESPILKKSNHTTVMPDILSKRSLSRPQTKASLIKINETINDSPDFEQSFIEQSFIISKDQDKKSMPKQQPLAQLNKNFNNIQKPLVTKRTVITAKLKKQSPSPKRFQGAPYRTTRGREIDNRNYNNENEYENDEGEIMDEEFQKYLPKAIEKCANWLIRYVFVNNDENNNINTDR
ncbi:unnamed protein product, partial [Didymodactylos carnosus]